MQRILIVDDENLFRRELRAFLEREGHDVAEADSGATALARFGEKEWDLVLLDLVLPDIGGVEVLRHLTHRAPETAVIVITACASLETSIEALRLGALDYLTKPLNLSDLALKLEKIQRYRSLRNENQLLKHMLVESGGFGEIIGESAPIRQVFREIKKVATTSANVLITGESGVGKELIARAIHQASPNRKNPFIPVNVSAIPSELVESRLFGHIRGAFTGAVRSQKGLFQSAQDGTVFLDEIGELPLEVQPKLLRVLEEKEILPIGAERPSPVEFRLVAATNRDLTAMVKSKRFREDLYYRLNVFQIAVPPLRKRREDIPLLVNHFVRTISQAMGKPLDGVSSDAMERLISADWRGNVRELRNVIERAIILAETNQITTPCLPHAFTNGRARSLKLKDVLDGCERSHIELALQLAGDDRQRAAKMLDVSLATLYRRLEKHSVTHPNQAESEPLPSDGSGEKSDSQI